MKKLTSILLTLIMLISVGSVALTAQAATPKSATVYFTLSNSELQLEQIQKLVVVKDLNNDNKLTINEAFIAAHDTYYEGGASAGYGVNNAFIYKFWGVETSNLMYAYNNAIAGGLSDEVSEGGQLHVYFINDILGFSDAYSYFNINKGETLTGNDLSLNLKMSKYDMNANANVTLPVDGATITIDGVATSHKTDVSGNVTLSFDVPGNHIISATIDNFVLVPPVAAITVNPNTANVFVTVVDDNKEFKLTQEAITVTDKDNDSKLTVYDAFVCAHDQKFVGGSAQGFRTSASGFIEKLWGVENGGSYGYYLNANMCMGINEAISNNDYLDAFIYSDAANYTDTYTFFDKQSATINSNDTITLTLNKYEYDPVTYAPIKKAVSNADITINGVATSYKTDANGNVAIKLSDAGNYTITATSDEFNMVPAACIITVNSPIIDGNTTPNVDANAGNDESNSDEVKSPQTGNEEITLLSIVLISTLGLLLVATRKSNKYEK